MPSGLVPINALASRAILKVRVADLFDFLMALLAASAQCAQCTGGIFGKSGHSCRDSHFARDPVPYRYDWKRTAIL